MSQEELHTISLLETIKECKDMFEQKLKGCLDSVENEDDLDGLMNDLEYDTTYFSAIFKRMDDLYGSGVRK